MKRIIPTLLVLSLIMNFVLIYLIWVFPNDVAEEYESITITRPVDRVIDGGTIAITIGERVRLLGIKTPQSGEECFASARDKLRQMIGNNEVTLIADKNNRDENGMLLRWIFVNGKNINIELVKAGLVEAFITDEKKYVQEILDAEQEAQENKIGCLWTE